MPGDIYRTLSRTFFKAAPSDREWSVRAVLSVPLEDLAGDLVDPAGLNFDLHRADPWVDIEHEAQLKGTRRPVGWARPTLSVAGGEYAVTKAKLDVPGLGAHELPIGTTYFDRDDPLQRQVYHLVRSGALPGVSLEFRPVEGFFKSRGFDSPYPAPLPRRDAYEFARADVVRWTHCVEPVCPGALTVLKSLPAELDPLAKVLRDKRIGSEVLHEHILKSLSRYQPTTTLVAVSKSMDSPETTYDPDMPEETTQVDPDEGGSPANNGVTALFAHAQMIEDACDQFESDLDHTDNPQLYKEAQKICEDARALAEKAKQCGDKHDKKLQAMKSGEEPDEADEPEDAEEAEPDMEKDDEGVFKAVRPVYRPILKAVRAAKRYSLAEVVKGIELARADSRPETTAEALARLQREDPAAYAKLEAKARRNRRLSTA